MTYGSDFAYFQHYILLTFTNLKKMSTLTCSL